MATKQLQLVAETLQGLGSSRSGRRTLANEAKKYIDARALPSVILPPGGQHLTTKGNVRTWRNRKGVPRSKAWVSDPPYLRDPMDRVDALGMRVAAGTATKSERDRLSVFLVEFGRSYNPPNGEGKQEGGEPSVMHRDFFGMLRAAGASDTLWRDAELLRATLAGRLSNWWDRTDWIRGNHAGASILTMLYTGRWTVGMDGRKFSGAEVNGQSRRHFGFCGFFDHVRYAIVSEDSLWSYDDMKDRRTVQMGSPNDFSYKPRKNRLEYAQIGFLHMLQSTLLVHFTMRDVDRKVMSEELEIVASQLTACADWFLPFWSTGVVPTGSKRFRSKFRFESNLIGRRCVAHLCALMRRGVLSEDPEFWDLIRRAVSKTGVESSDEAFALLIAESN